MARFMRYLPFADSTTPLQAVTYLLGISLFSIAFLVFLNSSISFVITDLIGVKDGVGDIVGTLGFVDELVALVACPVWGLVSDRMGVRFVAMIGYGVIGIALFLFVQAKNVYPQLLLARIFFAIGATAAATMVTAILPSLTDDSTPSDDTEDESRTAQAANPARYSLASVESELTITPERFVRLQSNNSLPGYGAADKKAGKPNALAGYVGLFTGCGALVSLVCFLPLPAQFNKIEGVDLGEAVMYAYYTVGAIAIVVAAFVYIGLRKLKGEDGKSLRGFLGLKKYETSSNGANEDGTGPKPKPKFLPYKQLLKDAVRLGFSDSQIALGYLGGFVARASTVAISAFIPLFINQFYHHKAVENGKSPGRQAYVLASILTGVAQLLALFCAPIFGYMSARRGRYNIPIIVATSLGIIGYIAFPNLPTPEYKDIQGRGGSPSVFLIVALIGISQIGAIVCSLGSLGRGVLTADLPKGPQIRIQTDEGEVVADAEDAPLLENGTPLPATATRAQLKGTIAGVYSWCGAAAILLLTKLGGYLFDKWTQGAPFYLMAIFNGILLAASLFIDITNVVRTATKSHDR